MIPYPYKRASRQLNLIKDCRDSKAVILSAAFHQNISIVNLCNRTGKGKKTANLV